MSASENSSSSSSNKLESEIVPKKDRTTTFENKPQIDQGSHQKFSINLDAYDTSEINEPEFIPKSTTTFDLDTIRSTGTFGGSIESPVSACSGNKGSDSFDEFAANSTGKSYNSLSHDLEEGKSMDVRKLGGKSTSELERKKLEAELKATEEIAKIKQSVIEKRLALELASINNNTGFGHKKHSQQADLRAIEEMAMRKQALVESNLAQELSNLEYQHQFASPRVQHTMALSVPPPQHPPPPTQPPAIPGQPRQSEVDVRNTSNYSETGFLNSDQDFRGTKRMESRTPSLDRRISGPEFRNPTQGNEFMNSRTDMRYAPTPDLGPQRYAQMDDRQPYSRPGQPVMPPPVLHDMKGRSVWRSIFGKVKKTFKGTKTPEGWQ